MIVLSFGELPKEYRCRLCGKSKPIGKMIVIRSRRKKKIILRPRCKDCQNHRERGHRREWKRNYLRKWREYNAELNESYWRQSNAANREMLNTRARARIEKYHHAILIQGRLRRRLNMHVTLAEAVELLKKYGPCYPTQWGLTPKGLREAERLRSIQRRIKKSVRLRNIEIRMMLYEDNEFYFIKPRFQKLPYQHAAMRMSEWQNRCKQRQTGKGSSKS